MAEMKVMVRCPVCEGRILDKISVTSGEIEIKCPRCGKIVKVDLALRLRKSNVRYRRAG